VALVDVLMAHERNSLVPAAELLLRIGPMRYQEWCITVRSLLHQLQAPSLQLDDALACIQGLHALARNHIETRQQSTLANSGPAGSARDRQHVVPPPFKAPSRLEQVQAGMRLMSDYELHCFWEWFPQALKLSNTRFPMQHMIHDADARRVVDA